MVALGLAYSSSLVFLEVPAFEAFAVTFGVVGGVREKDLEKQRARTAG